MEELKSLIPDDPTGLLRTRYKYIHSKTSVYILTYFIIHYDNLDESNDEGRDIVVWSLYHDSNTVLLEEQISAMSDFN